MTRILVFSDTHGSTSKVNSIIRTTPHDLVIHLGDHHDDLPEALSVKGNCDGLGAPLEQIQEIEGLHFFLCHGHRYNLKGNKKELALIAKSLGCDVALFCHTHKKYDEVLEGVLLLCPGSPVLPRDGTPSYLKLEVNQGTLKKEFVLI